TRLQGDWSSDVCSSDLDEPQVQQSRVADHEVERDGQARVHGTVGEDQRPELCVGPARVVLDVLQTEGNECRKDKKGNQHHRPRQRMIPTRWTGFPQALERMDRRGALEGGRLRAHARSVRGWPNRPCGRISSTVMRARNTKVS